MWYKNLGKKRDNNAFNFMEYWLHNAALTSDSPRAQLTRSVLNTIKEKDADIIAIQETKLRSTGPTKKHQEVLAEMFPNYDYVWRSSEEPARKGYAGTMFLYKNTLTPEVTKPAIGAPDTMDYEGRILTLEFDNYYVTQVYTPNSGNELKRLEDRQIWDEKYTEYLQKLDKSKPVIASGDYNVAHTPIDLKHQKITTITLALLMKSVKALINYWSLALLIPLERSMGM